MLDTLCDWKSLNFLSKKYKFILINDACHSMGSKIDNNFKYATYYSDFVTHSYHPVKAITTGEGGSIISKNKKIAKELSKYVIIQCCLQKKMVLGIMRHMSQDLILG